MKEILVKGKLEFCPDLFERFDRSFFAVLQQGRSFSGGYRSVVIIVYGVTSGGYMEKPDFVETSYDRSIKFTEEDFKDWLRNYFSKNRAKHVLTFDE